MPVNLMGIMKLTGLACSRVRKAKRNMGVNDGSWRKRSYWAVGFNRPRVTRHEMTRYARSGFVAAANYKAAFEFEEAVAELRSVLNLAL